MQLNNKIKFISIIPLGLLLIIALYISYATYDSSITEMIKQPALFYVSLVLVVLVFSLLILGYLAGKELNSNSVNFQELLENSILDNEELYDASGLSMSQEIDLKSKQGVQNAYKLIETLIESAKADKQQALEANASKSLFLANMSHEIRTPLNGVVGFTELLKSTKIDEEQKEFINIIEKSSENLLNIINNILDLSK